LKIVKIENIISIGDFSTTSEWNSIRGNLHSSIKLMVYPEGSDKFYIYPESGKQRGQGNGVTPIKNGLMADLATQGWKLEEPLELTSNSRPGKLDAVFHSTQGPVALEWETGNISSSHRALNKMALGLLKGVLAAGILVVPSANLAKFLTDRIGNYPKLVPYLELWSSVPCKSGVLEIIVVEHDEESYSVPRIKKGSDGRALQ
jgi:hypothetical protein